VVLAKPTICPKGNADPLYVEASALLSKRLTGIGRLVARLLAAIAQLRPVRLVTTIQWETARNQRLSTSLLCGQEIDVTAQDVSDADDKDIVVWARQILQRPRRRHDPRESSRHTGLYTMLRPAERHFRRELCLLYDFTPLLLPWSHTTDTRENFGNYFAQTSGLCDKAVAISHSTKHDASWLCALRPEDVVVCHPGPSVCVQGHACDRNVSRRDDVLLVVSTLEPRKNGRFLLDWFLETSVLASGAELWWVGPQGWLCDGIKRIRRKSRGRSIKLLGMISDRSLCEAYRQAGTTIYPSLYEGFGFPVLDSLWHGTPVLCSFNSSLQEFALSGVYFFDGCDPGSLDEAYRAMAADRPVAIARSVLEERFSWDRMARTVESLCA
jgi:glycosyltransferase involved in cell wall biosynthesis